MGSAEMVFTFPAETILILKILASDLHISKVNGRIMTVGKGWEEKERHGNRMMGGR